MLSLIGGQDRLHGPARALEQIEDQVRGVLDHVENSHGCFSAQPDQQVVAHQEEDHLVQILHGGGHARLQRGERGHEPAPPGQGKAQGMLLTEEPWQVDTDGDDLSQCGGQCRTPRSQVKHQHQKHIQRDVTEIARDRADSGPPLAAVVAQIVVQYVGQIKQRRGRHQNLQIVLCGGIQCAVRRPCTQQRQQRLDKHAAQDRRGDAEQQRQAENTVEAVRRLGRPPLAQQPGIADRAAQPQPVGEHTVDHIDRQDQTDGGKTYRPQPLPHHHGVRHIAERPAQRRQHGRYPQTAEHTACEAVLCTVRDRYIPRSCHVTRWSGCRKSR